ncbi:hypothetical protein ElyMa_004227000 [Elysia marginata]|uniref:BRO1 domain-containing protein n=1 Tax=Elysia marginata TaxID=1093978 RepID=A0AAV4GQK1_9GAST|nr:hypothetical protein ElyMa_004227000 [Elysia marginata]
MAEGLEPVDVSKRQYIENVVEPDMYTAITELANTRKKIPLKCVKEARKEANNNIHYYGKACVGLETEPEAETLSASLGDNICEVSGVEEVPGGLDTLSKFIAACSEERQELQKAQRMMDQKLDSLSHSESDFKHKLLVCPSFHSDDFVVDKSVPLYDEM